MQSSHNTFTNKQATNTMQLTVCTSVAASRPMTSSSVKRASQVPATNLARRQQAAGGSGSSSRRQRRHLAAAQDQELETEDSGAIDGGNLQATTSYSSAEQEGEDESRDFALAMARMAWETKAEDILVLHVAPVVYWTRYMLIATVFSRPQLNAILGKMEKEAQVAHGRQLSVSPSANSGGWELLDYGDVVVHVMTAEQREYYDLETFYGAADEVELPFEDESPDVETWTNKL